MQPYEIRHAAAVLALDAANGKIVWRWPLTQPAGEYVWGFAASPALDDGIVVLGALNGTLYAFPATR